MIPTSEPEAKAAPRAQYYLDDGSGGEKSVRFEGDGNSEASTSARGSLSAEAAPAPATPSRVSKRRGQKRRSTMAVDPAPHRQAYQHPLLDGGGVKGLNLLQMGREIERRTGKALCDTFDLVCGTKHWRCGRGGDCAREELGRWTREERAASLRAHRERDEEGINVPLH